MKASRPIVLCLLLGASLPGPAQEAAPSGPTSPSPDAAVASAEKESPASPAIVPLAVQPTSATAERLHQLNITADFRRPWNGDCDWLTLASLSFGGRLDEHNRLGAAFGAGVVDLKSGSRADAQARQPGFVELGPEWQYDFAPPDALWKPYATASASLLWMSWEYRHAVDSKNFGPITRDYLEGFDGYAGLGLSVQLRKRLDLFGQCEVGGIGFLPATYSGVHNNLFANFGYVGIRGGLRLKF